MATQITDELVSELISAVESFMGMTLSYQEACARLSANGHDLDRAVNEILDNPADTKYRYDPSQFGADRDGAGSSNIPAFNIEAEDDFNTFASGAPSRPPSRSNNKSPIGDVLNLTSQRAAANPFARMTSNQIETEDKDLKEAIALSKAEAGIMEPQEYGTIRANGQIKFGPANQDATYNTEQWAMTLVNTNAEEVDDLPDAVDRRREVGQPSFLRPAFSNNRIPALITIFHEIPLLRELFISRENVAAEYGFEKRWWDGVPISPPDQPPRYSATTAESQEAVPPTHKLVNELQRLMAFLDKTDRSYGSADALCRMVSRVQQSEAPGAMEVKLLEKWKALQNDSKLSNAIFSQVVNIESTGEDTEPHVRRLDFSMFDMDLPHEQDIMFIETLYDLIDRTLWAQSGDLSDSSAHVSRIADVVCFRLSSNPGTKSVLVPATWYPDRYLEKSKQVALEMRLRKDQMIERLKQANSLERKLTNYKVSNGSVVKVQYLLERAIKITADPILDPEKESEIDPDAIERLPTGRSHRDVAGELQRIVEKIDLKLKDLSIEKEHCIRTLRELSNLYVEQTPEQELLPYTLSGVSATKDLTFILRKAEPELIDMDLDATEPRSDNRQWWRLHYNSSATDQKPVTVTKVTEDDVMDGIAQGTDPILVYANENAMSQSDKPLPDALEAFVRADNLSFSEEFPEVPDWDTPSDITSPKSPGKRKFDESGEHGSRQESPSRMTGTEKEPIGDDFSSSSKNAEDDDNSLLISHHESAEHAKFVDADNMIIGVDPDDTDLKSGAPVQEPKSLTTEMQSRIDMPSLLPSALPRKDQVPDTNSRAVAAAKAAWAAKAPSR